MTKTDVFERIERAQNHEPSETPPILECPVEGCSRVVVGRASDLRHHVRQASDPLHHRLQLSEDLELEWRDGHESVYQPDDPWRPGPPIS